MAVSGAEIILVDKNPDHHYAVVTLNREERANSLSLEFFSRLEQVWLDLRDDDDIWAIVLTAAGDRFFSVGIDLKERASLDAGGEGGWKDKEAELLGGRLPRIDPSGPGLELWKPIVAAVNGTAMAGGFLLAMICDVRIAAEHARFGIPEARWNLPAPFAAQLQRHMPPAIAKEMTLWARDQSALRMYEIGFVNKVVERGRELDEAIDWAKEVCELGPVSVRTHKELMHRYLHQDSLWAERLALAMFDKVVAMEDSIEGPRAFVEKRKPKWKLQ